jgi:hypothetical protein
MPAYNRNHVLSKCLLKRFANTEDKLKKNFLESGRSVMTQPGRDGFQRNMWLRQSAAVLELLWSSQAESAIGRVFFKLDHRRPLTRNDKKLVAKMCAIHYIRSKEFIRLYKRLAEDKSQTVSLRDPDFVTRYLVRLSLLRTMTIPSDHFEMFIKEYFPKCVAYLQKFSIEVGVAAGRERFILPDGGLLVSDVETNRYQPSGGVSLLEARQAVLPFGPKHLVAFTTKRRPSIYLDLTDREVLAANEKLKMACIQAYYSSL